MPKVLENIREKLVLQAREQIRREGYSAMSIRSVAKACGIASGTVYNYFPSKETLVAAFMLEDWNASIKRMKQETEGCPDPLKVLSIIHEVLKDYIDGNKVLFRDPQAGTDFASSVSKRHGLLIGQLVHIAEGACGGRAFSGELPVVEFAIETLLLWTIQERDFADYLKIIDRLFV